MTKLTKIAAIALLLLGVLLGVMAFMGARKAAPEVVPALNQVEAGKISVAVAARDLPAGHLITTEDVKIEKMAQMPSNGFGAAQLLQGKSTAVEIAQGQSILSTALIDGLAGLLAPGERAVSIKVDEASAVGHKLQPGDWVDVFAVLRKDGQEVDASQARMLLPHKKVLAYGALIHGDAQVATEGGSEKKNENKNAVARTAVLAVQVEEVNRLLLAEQYGQVQLALRSPLDHNKPSADILKQVAAVSVASQTSGYIDASVTALDNSLVGLTMGEFSKRPSSARAAVAKPVQVVQPAPAKVVRRAASRESGNLGVPVEVIRGTRKETVRY